MADEINGECGTQGKDEKYKPPFIWKPKGIT